MRLEPAFTVPQPLESPGWTRAPRAIGLSKAEFRAIYETWLDEVSRWVHALGGPRADRDDIVQEVFVVVADLLRQLADRQIGGSRCIDHPLRLRGLLGFLAWLFVHITFLTGFANRFTTLLHWGRTFLAGKRSQLTYSSRFSPSAQRR